MTNLPSEIKQCIVGLINSEFHNEISNPRRGDFWFVPHHTFPIWFYGSILNLLKKYYLF